LQFVIQHPWTSCVPARRLDPGIIPFRKAHICQIPVGGGEFNLAANLSDCFGLRTGVVTVMVNYSIRDLVAERLRGMGVISFHKMFQPNGANTPNIRSFTATEDTACVHRYFYRAKEAAAQLKPGNVDRSAIFVHGVRWFHSGRVFAALSHSTPELIVEGMQAARNFEAVQL
jgi:2-dehydro-3-deoxygluconokinase